MVLSLGLLAVFELLFLKKVYADELDSLKRETGLLFVNSVQNIQGEFLDKIMLRRTPGTIDSVAESIHRMPGHMMHDSVKVFVYAGKSPLPKPEGSHFKIQITNDQKLRFNPEVKGSLSVISEVTEQRIPSDSFCPPGMPLDSTKLKAMLESNFGKAMTGSGFVLPYFIGQVSRDSIRDGNTMKVGSYTDLFSGQQYDASLTDFKGYVFRQMLPQLLFAILLFVCVSLAFLFIYQTMHRQHQLAEQKNDFIRNVTHELKTPIATVSVAIEALQNFDALQDPERTREYLDISRMELSRLSLLVDKVLRMSLFEKGEPELKLEPLDFKTLVEEILASMKIQFEKFGARVGFKTQGSDFSMEGDRLHLASVVYNLLDNALKYSSRHPEIAISLDQDNDRICLEVHDNGIGIPAAYQHKIFEQFFRVPTGNVHNVKGHGLGLSYVAGVVRRHEGTISVESREGFGTCFTIAFQTQHHSK